MHLDNAGVEGDTAGCKGDVRFASSFLVEQPSHCRGGLPIQRVSGHPLLDWQWRALNLKNVYDTVGDDVQVDAAADHHPLERHIMSEPLEPGLERKLHRQMLGTQR